MGYRQAGASRPAVSPASVLLVLDEVALVVAVVGGGGRVEVERAVLERQTELGELLLDLGDGLRTEVADVQEVGLRARNELTHGVDALTLEAVVGADRELQVLDRQGQVRSERGIRRRRADLDALGLDVELTGQTEQLHQRL